MSEDIVDIVIVGGKVRCIYVNDHRIAGSKPYVSESQTTTTFKVPAGEIRKHLKRKSRPKS